MLKSPSTSLLCAQHTECLKVAVTNELRVETTFAAEVDLSLEERAVKQRGDVAHLQGEQAREAKRSVLEIEKAVKSWLPKTASSPVIGYS